MWRERGEAAGRVLGGHKIGLTSKAMQHATGSPSRITAIIFKDMILENGATVEWEQYSHPRIEVELAFLLKEDVSGPDATIFDVLRATEYVVPALEILDSRIEMEGRTIVDTISDNAAMGAMVVGGTPVKPDALDLRWVSALLFKNQTIEETGVAAGVLNHPAQGVSGWPTRSRRTVTRSKRGNSSSPAPSPAPCGSMKGDTVFADYGKLGTITCQFD